jgi:transposase
MRPPLFVRPLSSGQVATLEARYRRTPVPGERTRCHIVLLSHQGLRPPAIAAIVRVHPDTVRRTIRRYNTAGLAGLPDRARSGRPPTITSAWIRLLLKLVEQDPQRGGVHRTAWTAPALAAYVGERTGIRVGPQVVRRQLRKHGYVPRRPTWTVRHVARRDPAYASKSAVPRRSS